MTSNSTLLVSLHATDMTFLDDTTFCNYVSAAGMLKFRSSVRLLVMNEILQYWKLNYLAVTAT